MFRTPSSRLPLLLMLGTIVLAAVWALNGFAEQRAAVVFDPPARATSSAAASSKSPASSAQSEHSSSAETAPRPESSPIVTAAATTIPRSVRIRVPFGVQAPHANWNPPYDESCEEASLVLVKAFLDGESAITPGEMDRRILDLVAWENNAGLPIDITLEQLARVAEESYGLRATLTQDPSIDDIKRTLAAGTPVIVPLAGRDLGNPYYSGEGPWYHVLVITGYDGKVFYTQDVGTRRGADYAYRHAVLHDAIHDWTGVKEEIRQGKKVMLTVGR